MWSPSARSYRCGTPLPCEDPIAAKSLTYTEIALRRSGVWLWKSVGGIGYSGCNIERASTLNYAFSPEITWLGTRLILKLTAASSTAVQKDAEHLRLSSSNSVHREVMAPNINKPVPGAKEFYPLNEPSIGTTLSPETFPRNKDLPPLFTPLTIRGVTFPNRVFVSPMCQYSSDNGHATDWHLVHIGGFASRGAGGIVMEATAVVPEGRISPEDAGLWTDSQIAPLRRVVDFVHAQTAKVGVQLAHAGRKASTLAPWVKSSADRTHRANTSTAFANEGGWPDNVYGPVAAPWSDQFPTPKAMTEADMQRVIDAFAAAAKRAVVAGFDFIQIHGAHGYLIHAFLSPISNTRSDDYGGQSFENRIRFPLRVVEAVREAWGDRPLFVRLSATDWVEGPEKDSEGRWLQWGVEQTILFTGELKKLGVDLIDVSSGGNWSAQKVVVRPGYQVPFAEAVKKAHPDIPVGAVGLITTPKQANDVLVEGRADIVSLAREILRDPHFVLRAADELGVAVRPAVQYERAWQTVLARL